MTNPINQNRKQKTTFLVSILAILLFIGGSLYYSSSTKKSSTTAESDSSKLTAQIEQNQEQITASIEDFKSIVCSSSKIKASSEQSCKIQFTKDVTDNLVGQYRVVISKDETQNRSLLSCIQSSAAIKNVLKCTNSAVALTPGIYNYSIEVRGNNKIVQKEALTVE
jgi:uncharacterized protein (UPF0333 family)